MKNNDNFHTILRYMCEAIRPHWLAISCDRIVVDEPGNCWNHSERNNGFEEPQKIADDKDPFNITIIAT